MVFPAAWHVLMSASISGQRSSGEPGKGAVQRSPALAKLRSVGALMPLRKARGMMLTGVSAQ